MKSKEIMNKYDNLYKERHLSMQETTMCWGLEVGDGWLELIDNVSSLLNEPFYSSIVELKDVNGDSYKVQYKYPYVVFKQVKEKFGELRIYFECEFPELDKIPSEISSLPENKKKLNEIVRKSYDIVDGVIVFAEHLSRKTCEVCGEKGTIREGSWIKTLCEKHYKKEN